MVNPVNSIYNYQVTNVIAPRPITIDDMINQLKLDTSLCGDPVFVAEMNSFIDVAIGICEKVTRRTIRESEFSASLDCFSDSYHSGFYYWASQEFEIRKSPLQSLDSINYLVDGVSTLLASTEYDVSITKDFSIMAPKYGGTWPQNVDVKRQAITLALTAGYPEDKAPEDLLNALKQHVAALWSHRGDCDNGATSGMVACGCGLPSAVKNVYHLYKIMDLRIGF